MNAPEDAPDDAAAVRLPPPVVFLLAIVLAVLLGYWSPRDPWPRGPFPRLLGLLSIGYGLWLALGAIRQLSATGQNLAPWKPTPEVVTVGPYAHSRNPIYVGMASVVLGLGYLLNNGWFSLTAVGAVIIVHRYVVLREEAYLERKFGEVYLDYKRRVRRWL